MSLESSQPASPVQSSRHTLPDAGSKCDGEDEAKRAKLDHSQSQVSSHPRARGDHANESGSESDEEDTSGLLLKTQKPVSTELPVALNSTNQSSESSTPKIVRGPMQGRVDLPRKVALLFMYYGVGYYGLQRNPNSPYRAVEDELLDALVAANAINAEDVADPMRRLQFQRCARTDKSVSALGQCCSLRLRIVPFGTFESAASASATATPAEAGGTQAPASCQSQQSHTAAAPPATDVAAGASDSSSTRPTMEPAASAAGPHDTNGPATAAPKTDAVHAVGKGGRTDPNAADCARLVDRINEQLSDQIRVIDVLRVRNNFDAKNECDFRTYLYLLPTFVLAPVEQFITTEFTISQSQLELFRKFLDRYRGTHRFHNFTSGMKYEQPQSRRFMMELTVDEPRVVRALASPSPAASEAAGVGSGAGVGECGGREWLECVLVCVRGQSFMLNQIRKMLGLAVAVVRGVAPDAALDLAFGPAKVELPRIPGLGLMLDRVHYQYYNRRYGADGLHVAVDWARYEETMNRFRDEYIWPRIVRTEIEQRPIWNWLQDLNKFTYTERVQTTSTSSQKLSSQEEAINAAPDANACPPTVQITLSSGDAPQAQHSNAVPSV